MSEEKTLLERAEKLFSEKKNKDLVSMLSDHILDTEQSAILYALRGRAHYRLSQAEDAMLYANKALSIDSNCALAYLVRGNGWLYKKEYDKALEDYNRCIDIDPTNTIAFSNRGVVWHNKGDYLQELKDYGDAITLDQRNVMALNNRGIAFTNQGEFDLAIEDFNKALEIDPEFANAYNNRASTWFEKQEYDKAIEDYAKAIVLGNEGAQYRRDRAIERKQERQKLELLGPSNYTKKLSDVSEKLDTIIEEILRLSTSGRHDTTAHYTKLLVADKLLARDESKDKDKQGRLRYYNAIYMNDPMEGEYIFECFGKHKERIKEVFDLGKSRNETSVYLGSFLTNNDGDLHEDELLMWRTYGKDEKQTEAAGCSMIIHEDFFDKHNDAKLSGGNKMNDEGHLPPQGLYNVIYYKASKYENVNPELIKKAMDQLELLLLGMIDLRNTGDEEARKLIEEILFKRLSEICYLFKSSDFLYEHEVRVIQYMPRGTDMIQTDESYPPKLFVPSNKPLLPYLKKIYVGPKAENAEHWLTYLDLRIRRLRKADSIPYSVEVLRSGQKFR